VTASLGAVERLARQLEFVVEADRLKHVLRRTSLFDGSRKENDVEHSWSLALMALVLAEHSPVPLDLHRVIGMVLIHDLPEIDAGDTFLYAQERGQETAAETAGANRIFSLLPDDLAAELLGLWHEFEERKTPEARFAAALDRLEPLLQNLHNGGVVWRENGIGKERVLAANAHIADGSAFLWEQIKAWIDQAQSQGLFAPD
jgi:putative hydrolases of HD superfamily